MNSTIVVPGKKRPTLDHPGIPRGGGAEYQWAEANDFFVQVWVRDPEHLRELVMSSFTARGEVAHIETGLIFEHTQSLELPVYVDYNDEEE